ncbi:MAG: hypothetical protein ABIG37_03075 [Nanoarchaeota archaeon]|nr:hypothetical protein [Nanoarchaeota archaeon]
MEITPCDVAYQIVRSIKFKDKFFKRIQTDAYLIAERDGFKLNPGNYFSLAQHRFAGKMFERVLKKEGVSCQDSYLDNHKRCMKCLEEKVPMAHLEDSPYDDMHAETIYKDMKYRHNKK